MTIEEDGTIRPGLRTMKSDKVMVTSPPAMSLLCNEVGPSSRAFTDRRQIKDYWKASQVTINDETITFPTHSEMIYEINHIHECMEKGWLTSPIASKERTLFHSLVLKTHHRKMVELNSVRNDRTSESPPAVSLEWIPDGIAYDR